MKALFEDEVSSNLLTVGSNGDKLELEMSENQGSGTVELLGIIEFDLQEAYSLQKSISGFIYEIEERERKRLPFWKRIF